MLGATSGEDAWPSVQNEVIVVVVSKNSKPDPVNYRPIYLFSTPGKDFKRITAELIRHHLGDSSLLSCQQLVLICYLLGRYREGGVN